MRYRAAIMVLTGVLALAGCGGEAPAPAPAETATATPAAPPGIALSEARIQLPVVSGRPGAAYLTISQASGPARAITAVSVEMAGRTELHETTTSGEMSSMKPLASVPLASGQTVKFEPGGKHVMLFDLDPKLRFAKEARITVVFDNGDDASIAAPVTTVGEAMEHDH